MPITDLPTLDGKVAYEVQVAIDRLKRSIEEAQAQHADLATQLDALPPDLTFEEIQQGLSATGAAPLNLTGLV